MREEFYIISYQYYGWSFFHKAKFFLIKNFYWHCFHFFLTGCLHLLSSFVKKCECDVRKSYLPRKIWFYIESNWDKMTQNHMSILFLGSFFRASVGVICFVNSFFFQGEELYQTFLFHTTYHLIFSWISKIKKSSKKKLIATFL